MAFQFTSRSLSIQGSILQAECCDYDRNWRLASINLDEVIGNSDGSFSLYSRNFSRSAKDIQLVGSSLSANLQKHNGQHVKAIIDLNLFIANMNGSLEFQKLFVNRQV